MNKKISLSLALFAACVSHANANNLKFDKPFTTTVSVTKASKTLAVGAKKQVTLMAIHLNDKQKKALLTFEPQSLKQNKPADSNIPDHVYLGMGEVPVLDQGNHGTCVTFATTAAVNAALKKNDYISQLCELELGNYLHFKGYYTSGWEGTFAPVAFDQMLRFGIINKTIQKTQGCAGVKNYPEKSTNEGNIMSPEDYRYVSEDISDLIHIHSHMDAVKRDETGYKESDAEIALKDIKHALSQGNRVVFGTYLLMAQGCDAGACASYKAKKDTWALTQQVINSYQDIAGHEMVIIGYDDQAVVTDDYGVPHKGLLILRNSWGPFVGDNGNYYMTYEYFKKFSIEVNEIELTKTK